MKLYYSEKHILHNPPFEHYDGVEEPYAEKADRLVQIAGALRECGYILEEPKSFSKRHIRSLHQGVYINFLKRCSEQVTEGKVLYPSYHIMDTYTPITSGTFPAAKSSADVALTGASAIKRGERLVYSLCRPPGHHAEYMMMGGYCYFNNAGIAANFLSQSGRVAILDVDFHHGNGTQHLFYERDDVYYISLHADPRVRFPYSSGFANEKGKGKGEGYTTNYPLPLGTTDEKYKTALQKALRKIRHYSPLYLIVSLGFDTYKEDPIGGFCLTIPFYHHMAREIASLNLPTLLIQEGGYRVDALGEIAASFLSGFSEEVNLI